MKRIAAFILTTCIAVGAGCQEPASHGHAESPDLLEHWRRATVSVGQLITDHEKTRYATVGSAVIVAFDQSHACLLTAKHVVFNPDEHYAPADMQIRIAQDEGVASSSDLGVKVALVVGGKNTWTSLPDGSDLAVVPLPDLSNYKNLHAVSVNDFGGSEDVFQGASILILGYPVILGEDYLTTPLARGGIISWTDPSGRLDKPFLVDANTFNGNSGGPVFHLQNGVTRGGGMLFNGGGLKLIGIMSQNALERIPIEVGGTPLTATDAQGRTSAVMAKVLNIGGIGVVQPISKGKRLIELACRPQ
jgi:hypothetical protein